MNLQYKCKIYELPEIEIGFCIACFKRRELCYNEYYLGSKDVEIILFNITKKKFYYSRIFYRSPIQSNFMGLLDKNISGKIQKEVRYIYLMIL